MEPNFSCDACGHKYSWARTRTKRFELCMHCGMEAVIPIYVRGRTSVQDNTQGFSKEPEKQPKLGKKKKDW